MKTTEQNMIYLLYILDLSEFYAMITANNLLYFHFQCT